MLLIVYNLLASTGLPNLADISAGYSERHVFRVVYCADYCRYEDFY